MALGFPPPRIVDSYRIGNKKQGRAIKVEVEHPTEVNVLLKSARKLKTSDMISVF